MAPDGAGDARPPRIAVLGDFDSIHTRSWVEGSAARGLDVHAISFYRPSTPPAGATLHVLRDDGGAGGGSAVLAPAGDRDSSAGTGRRRLRDRAPRGAVRLVQALRYRRAGLAQVVAEIAPDVLHAHFLVEHGFYGATLGVHPYVVTCWGSDVLVEPRRDPISQLIARWTLRRAEAVTSNNHVMAERLLELGARRDRVDVITLGADRYFLDDAEASVNMRAGDDAGPAVVLSTRAHEPLYNIGEIIRAFAALPESFRRARLVVAHGGSLTPRLRAQAAPLGERVEFAGFLDRPRLRDLMHAASVFISVPSSDGTSVALLQAMAVGCLPIVSDLATQRELVDDGVNGLRVPLHRPDLLAQAIARALADAPLRRRAAGMNRRLVEERGLNEHEMTKLEALYRRLAVAL
ncbi:MAG: glycosyltransferase [Dehalococcoidia bacterium]|nr:glycosyltransferase [Dehalococcoidia bacterium]